MSHFYEPEDYAQDDEPEYLPPQEGDESFPLHPEVTIRLTLEGEDGNHFVILAYTRQALRRAGVTSEEIARFTTEATSSGSPEGFRNVIRKWVSTDE